MADIMLHCTSCDHQFAVSEFIGKPEVECVKCNAPIPMPAVEQRSKLTLKKRGGAPPAPVLVDAEEGKKSKKAASEEAADGEQVEASAKSAIAENFKKRREDERQAAKVTVGDKVRKVGAMWEWVIFLLVGGALIGLQYLISSGQKPELLEYYRIGMWILVGAAWLAVVAVGFGASRMQGLLLAVCPPYWLYFALSKVDHKMLRGMVLGVLAALGAEMKFMPETSVINVAQTHMNAVIEDTRNLIARPPQVEFEK